MSEFPDWLEQERGPLWAPSYEEAQEIHRKLLDGTLKPHASDCPVWVGEDCGCVCQCLDGLVQEWLSKARAVASAKGFDYPAPAREDHRHEK